VEIICEFFSVRIDRDVSVIVRCQRPPFSFEHSFKTVYSLETFRLNEQQIKRFVIPHIKPTSPPSHFRQYFSAAAAAAAITLQHDTVNLAVESQHCQPAAGNAKPRSPMSAFYFQHRQFCSLRSAAYPMKLVA